MLTGHIKRYTMPVAFPGINERGRRTSALGRREIYAEVAFFLLSGRSLVPDLGRKNCDQQP